MHDLFINNARLFEELCTKPRLTSGYLKVRKNQGAAGIDGVSIEDFGNKLDEELSQLLKELVDWTYRPKAVKAVEIPKPGSNTDKRRLGIPCVRDRVVQAAIKELIEPILEPTFSDNSYGFRPGRSPHDAVLKAKEIVEQEGKGFVVDLDLEKFFDKINHDRLIARLGDKIQDKRILRLIGLMLRSGIMKDGVVSSTEVGSIQGSPLSPLLSNVVLDELDKELETRGHKFCRFADDCNIFVSTYKAAERVMSTITEFIERRLKLKVNAQKSKVAKSKEVKFLGFTIINGKIAIAKAAIDRAMDKVKILTPRGTHLSTKDSISQINKWFRGWSSYYSLGQYPAQLAKIEAHIRRRLRARIVKQQKRRSHLCNKLVKRGISRRAASKVVYSNKGTWRLSHERVLERAFPNKWFIETLGQVVSSTTKLPHWFDVKTWIRLP